MRKVSQLINNNGRPANNQFVLSYADKQVFQSYSTLIAEEHNNGKIVLDTDALNYSRTTSKHLFIFLGLDRREIETRVKEGLITVKDLN
jgi:hypothetical protein